MIKKLYTLLLLFPFFCWSQEEIIWHNNIEKAITIAKKQNKEVFLYFSMDKCVPCRVLKKYVLDKNDFINYSKKYIMVNIHDDLDKNNIKKQEYIKQTRQKYKIASVPRVLVLKDNKVMKHFFGYIKSTEKMITKLEQKD